MTSRTIWKASWAWEIMTGKVGKSGWGGRVLALTITQITSTLTCEAEAISVGALE